MRTGASQSSPGTRAGVFATTHWSVVLAAGDESSSQAGQALEELCHLYWFPSYAYIRRRGYGPEDAQDLTQEFLARFLKGRYLGRVDPNRGRFRSYLLGALKHFLADSRDRVQRLKRGGGIPCESFDVAVAEGRYAINEAKLENPDCLYDRQWALTLLQRVLARMEEEYAATGRQDLFRHLSRFLPGTTSNTMPESYRHSASELGMTEGATRVAVHRLRQRYGELFFRAVADTVGAREDVEHEMRHLLQCLNSQPS